jgi:hypothetical protein
MANWAQREAAERALSSTLSRTVDFLKFAETKNAALLTFASAWSLALANAIVGSHTLDQASRITISVALLLFAVAALIALYSFLPKLDLSSLFRDPDSNKSLLYFNDIAKFEPTAYSQRFRERYASAPEQSISDAYLNDLAVQVSANSSITRRKFIAFNFGAGFVILALAILTIRGGFLVYGHFLSK